MDFIELTGFSRWPKILVRAGDIQCLLSEDDGTIVTLKGGDYQRVNETPEEIISMLKAKENDNGKED